jgi:hypothetical protein
MVDDNIRRPKQLEESAGVEIDVVVDGFNKNVAWFEAGELACLLGHTESG